MTIECSFKTPREICVSIGNSFYSSKDHKRLYALPFNRYKPEDSIWWLSSSSENPAYKYGKFGFSPYNKTEVLIGLYVEKGLGADYCSIDGSKAALRMVMDKDWLWHDFLKDMAGNKVVSVLNEIYKRTNNSTEIHVWGGYASPGFEPEQPRYNWDNFEFIWEHDKQDVSSIKSVHDGNVLGNLENCPNLYALFKELSRFTDNSFVWIDLFIGTKITMYKESDKSWGSAEIVQNILEPLEEWVR